MHDYEVTFVLNPNLNDDEVATTTDRVNTLISNSGGEVVDVHPWGGKRRLAYPIQHHRDGYYITTKFRTSAEATSGLNNQLKLNDNIMRHVVIRLDSH